MFPLYHSHAWIPLVYDSYWADPGVHIKINIEIPTQVHIQEYKSTRVYIQEYTSTYKIVHEYTYKSTRVHIKEYTSTHKRVHEYI